jgi:mono/diheme cytochrome c family protein
MRRLIAGLALLALAGGAAFWWVTAPRPLPADAMAGITGDAKRGEVLFWAGGCASCHAAKGAEGAARLKLGGGRKLVTAFGSFSAPNISPDPGHGIGKWTALDLANAMLRGLAPGGRHLYPVFPYASYSHASLQDVADLRAFLATLPPVTTPNQPHQLRFPFGWRRLIGGWDWLYLRPGWVVKGKLTAQEARGRALAEGLGHCGECHTPRTALGGMDLARWFAGAKNPSGPGHIPNITPAKLDWSADDIVTYLTTGFTPSFDSAGSSMAEVVDNMAHLPKADVEAIAAYLRRVPPRP